MPQGRKKYCVIEQTVHHWLPSSLFMMAAGENIRIGFVATCPAKDAGSRDMEYIFLTPNQASAMGAWLSDEADRLRAATAKKIQRKHERAAAKANRKAQGGQQ